MDGGEIDYHLAQLPSGPAHFQDIGAAPMLAAKAYPTAEAVVPTPLEEISDNIRRYEIQFFGRNLCHRAD